MGDISKSSSSVNGKRFQKLTASQTKEAGSSWDNFKRQNGCVKVTDPYYGKRKQSNTIRRIQRKIQLMESRMSPDEQEISSRGNDKQESNSSRLETLSANGTRWKQNATNSEGIKRVNPPQTVPIIKISDASDDHPGTQIEDKDTWLTKDELLEIFFRSL